jgi:hypothetical protein
MDEVLDVERRQLAELDGGGAGLLRFVGAELDGVGVGAVGRR